MRPISTRETVRKPIAFAGVGRLGDNAQVVFHVQPADERTAQGIDVVHLVFDTGLLRETRGRAVDLLNRAGVRPRRRRLKLSGQPSREMRVQEMAILLPPHGVIADPPRSEGSVAGPQNTEIFQPLLPVGVIPALRYLRMLTLPGAHVRAFLRLGRCGLSFQARLTLSLVAGVKVCARLLGLTRETEPRWQLAQRRLASDPARPLSAANSVLMGGGVRLVIRPNLLGISFRARPVLVRERVGATPSNERGAVRQVIVSPGRAFLFFPFLVRHLLLILARPAALATVLTGGRGFRGAGAAFPGEAAFATQGDGVRILAGHVETITQSAVSGYSQLRAA